MPHCSCLVGLVDLVTSGGCVSVAIIWSFSASQDSRAWELMVGVFPCGSRDSIGPGN